MKLARLMRRRSGVGEEMEEPLDRGGLEILDFVTFTCSRTGVVFKMSIALDFSG